MNAGKRFKFVRSFHNLKGQRNKQKGMTYIVNVNNYFTNNDFKW